MFSKCHVCKVFTKINISVCVLILGWQLGNLNTIMLCGLVFIFLFCYAMCKKEPRYALYRCLKNLININKDTAEGTAEHTRVAYSYYKNIV